MINLTLSATMLSDWSVGSGRARHDSIDQTVRRDHEGLPCIPGKSFRGVWRDAVWSVASAFDESGGRFWTDWATWLFGGPSRGGHLVVPTLLVTEGRELLLAHPELRKACVTTRSSTAIDDAHGWAMKDALRVDEVARVGMRLGTTVSVDADSRDECWPGLLLMAGGLRLVDRVGGGRRHGRGRLKADLAELSIEHLLEQFAAEADPPTPRERVSTSSTTTRATNGPAPDTAGDPAWRRFVVSMVATEPLLFPDRVQGNAILGHGYAPGAALLPLLSRQIGDDFGEALRAGRVVVTPATPTPSAAVERSLPLPMCWRRLKVPADTERGLLVNEFRAEVEDDQGRERQTVAVRGFVAVDGATTTICVGRSESTSHNVIDPVTQRPGESGVYTYQALAAGTHLVFEVLASDASVAYALTDLVGLSTRLGAARSAEYGGVAIGRVDEMPALHPEVSDRPLVAGERFDVWLCSDLVLPSGFGVPGLLAALSQSLGTEVTLVDDDARPTARVEQTLRDSWQQSWGLPRPSLSVLAAGAVVRVTVDQAVPADRLRALHIEGLGMRRAEGFGRLLVAPRILAHNTVDAGTVEAIDASTTTSTTRLARGSEEAEWLSAVRRAAVLALVERAALARGDALGLPAAMSAAQLGSLREAAFSLSDGLARVRAWEAATRRVPRRREAWGGSLDRLKSLLDDPDSVWQLLAINDAVEPLAGGPPTRDMSVQALRTLLLTGVAVHRAGQRGTDDEDEAA